jgi:hypothetical protein
MHTLRMPLITTAYDNQVIERRFRMISKIHNATVSHAKSLLKKLNDKEYRKLLAEYRELNKIAKPTKDQKHRKAVLSKEMAAFRKSIGLTDYDLQSYASNYAKKFNNFISSQQAQKEGHRVYCGVERVLFGNGESLHFKKQEDFHTISGKSNLNGTRFRKTDFTVMWIGLTLKCKLPKNTKDLNYIYESLADNDISYCDIERLMFPNGWHYYVKIYLKGDAPKKLKSIGTGTMGIDPGVSTMAGASNDMVILEELAPNSRIYSKKIDRLQQRMDISKRNSNPQKYNTDGTVNKHNHDKWKYSNTYIKNKRKLKSLYRQKAAYTKQSHEILCNRLLKDSRYFYTEDMEYKALQHRAKKTERSSTPTDIKQRDGTVKSVHKYKRKKRFGYTLSNRAPSEFIAILSRKARLYGGDVITVKTKDFKASQYNHITGSYEKIPLNQRFKEVGSKKVQRDLYSAFLIKNANSNLTSPDRDKCMYEFDDFVKMQDDLIADMKRNGISMKQCFGF